MMLMGCYSTLDFWSGTTKTSLILNNFKTLFFYKHNALWGQGSALSAKEHLENPSFFSLNQRIIPPRRRRSVLFSPPLRTGRAAAGSTPRNQEVLRKTNPCSNRLSATGVSASKLPRYLPSVGNASSKGSLFVVDHLGASSPS